MNKWIEILLGLVLVIAAVVVAFVYSSWGGAMIEVLKGGLLWAIVGIGALFILLGISDLRG